MTSDKHLCVTLERDISIPGPNHYPAETDVFRAAEISIKDDMMTFTELNIGPKHTSVTIAKDNVRAIAFLGHPESVSNTDTND